MSFGVKILTQNGFVDIAGLVSAQYVSQRNITVAEGTTPTPSGVTPSNGGVLIQVRDGLEPPQCFIRVDGQTRWQNYAPSTSASKNFDIIWLRFS